MPPDYNFDPLNIILRRIDEHKEASGARHQALVDVQKETNVKLDMVISELGGGNVRFERVEATLRDHDKSIKAIEDARKSAVSWWADTGKQLLLNLILSIAGAASTIWVYVKSQGH